jgi:DNA gyrase subunit B
MLESEQIKNIVVALGTAIGDTFDLSKIRYHKIIVAADADVDGAHIRTLILTLFYRFFRPILEAGYVYIAQPPLYKIKIGKDLHYVYTEAEMEDFKKKNRLDKSKTEELVIDGNENTEEIESEDESDLSAVSKKDEKIKSPKVSIQRYKGLGEMNADELWETTMDPARRILKQVTIDDGTNADKVFDILMGTDVPARKSFIQSNATKATLDI